MTWIEEMRENVTSVEELERHIELTCAEKERIRAITDRYPMSITPYYLSLIDKNDPQDPIRKMCIPSASETDLSGSFDTSGEYQNTKVKGLQHKYAQTALVLSTNVCAMYCRHCFRKRLVGISDAETIKMLDHIADYIEQHKEIDNVLISGGDALMNSNHIIERLLQRLTHMDHLNFIRIGSRIPVVLPSRIYKDKELLGILKRYAANKRIYLVTQFNHPRELTPKARLAVERLLYNEVIVSNQTVLLKGVNDDPDTMAELMNRLTRCGVVPYYVFQCRPVTGVKAQFQIPLLKASRIIDETRSMLNGHAKRFKFVMSHEGGKIEIIGVLKNSDMVFKYHQSKDIKDSGRMFIQTVKDDQCWLDEVYEL
ncbi:MAG: L-lysine 2,3-aminomutase [Firmicutes bacterium ADurb.Bin182]|nr:MAG: L-lysine 2,3-aminomutase [Firmicutes bacterium ADurb.Bin182]